MKNHSLYFFVTSLMSLDCFQILTYFISRFLPDVFIPIIQIKEEVEEEREAPPPPKKKYTRKAKLINGPTEKTSKKGEIRVKAEFRIKLDDEDEAFECPICKNETKRNLKEMKAHYKTDHKGKRLRTALLTNEAHPCEICGKELRHKSALKEHIETHNNSYSCEQCGVNHKKPTDHVIHMRCHSEQGMFNCIFCEFNTTELLEIQKHMSGDHERTQKYHCNICNKGFQIFSWFVEHENYHTGLKPFGCEFCGKCFLYSRYLAAHRNSMHKEELTGVPNIHECVICKKQYQHKNSLNLHMNSHTGNFAICDICGKILSSKEKLKFHLRTHTGYKPFSCSYCGKCFTKKPILVEHVRIHTGERPYVCEYCNKCFSQRSSLVIHIRSHTGERPYVCQFCQKGFVAKAMLNIHLRSCKGIPITTVD
ncbi:hypothetical protein HHI36_018438 [Cryptolaemus montrouzieri]|uniref:C2H2-type domain-containing protein n=1 Tax=Cryptolaemus montrouzieri TaxID=559131 RepID=A0ABD2P0E7_9CUCU